jgi:hypothetical protein
MLTRKADAFGAHDLVLQSQQLLAQVSDIGSFFIQTAESFSSDILKLFSFTGNENTKVASVLPPETHNVGAASAVAPPRVSCLKTISRKRRRLPLPVSPKAKWIGRSQTQVQELFLSFKQRSKTALLL